VLNKLFEALYNKVIVSIVVKRASTDVYIELCSKNGTISQTSENFHTLYPTEEMIAFIDSYIKETPFHYLAFLDTSDDQGALPSCKKSELSRFYDLTISETKCYKDEWTYFTSKADINELEKAYNHFDVDFIFSPFLILNNFFQDKISSTLAMFILIQDSCISLAIFDHSKLLYGDHLDMEVVADIDDDLLSHDIEEEMNLESSKTSIDLEDIDVIDTIDDIEGLDDFGDIEDLDTLEEIDEFSENRDIEEEFYEAEEEPLEEGGEDSFNEDYQRFSLIQSSLGSYYSDEKYESQFIESVYIADGVGVSSDLKRYLEEEMFLNIYIRHLDLGMEVVHFVKEELGL